MTLQLLLSHNLKHNYDDVGSQKPKIFAHNVYSRHLFYVYFLQVKRGKINIQQGTHWSTFPPSPVAIALTSVRS